METMNRPDSLKPEQKKAGSLLGKIGVKLCSRTNLVVYLKDGSTINIAELKKKYKVFNKD
jgi:hypothetical protein